MAANDDQDYKVGRCRPPKHTRWKKGQSGNPGRIRKVKNLDVAKAIEAALRRKIVVTEGNQRKRMTAFEAILLQLWAKAIKGDTRAVRVFLNYQEFALPAGTGEVEVVIRK